MAAPLIAAAAMAAKHLAKKAAKARRKSGVKKDNKENAEDSTTKELSGELRFREPRRQPFDYADDAYGRTPRMSDDYKKGGKVKGYKAGGSIDGCAVKGKTRGRLV